MAQLTEDEWPKDGEPTTSEEEGVEFKRESSNPPTGVHGQDPADGIDDAANHREESPEATPDDKMPRSGATRGRESSRSISY